MVAANFGTVRLTSLPSRSSSSLSGLHLLRAELGRYGLERSLSRREDRAASLTA
jgi:hypothetical protein